MLNFSLSYLQRLQTFKSNKNPLLIYQLLKKIKFFKKIIISIGILRSYWKMELAFTYDKYKTFHVLFIYFVLSF